MQQQAPATARKVQPQPPLRSVQTDGAGANGAAVLLRACRPRQWLKNLLVALAPTAAGAITRPGVIGAVAGAFVCFCLLSSATYLVNDVRDREQDRRHPRKRYRPVASGELSPRAALRLAALLGGCGLALALAVRPLLAVVAVGYVTLTTSYSICWRHVVVADLVAVSGGFALRAVGGAAASGVGLSLEFMIVTCACSLFLIAGKRYAELLASGSRGSTRATLRRYSRRCLRLLLSASAGVGCAAYAWWAFTERAATPWRELSLLVFVLWLARYLRLLAKGAGESPEELVVGDAPLVSLSLAWLLPFMLGAYGTA